MSYLTEMSPPTVRLCEILVPLLDSTDNVPWDEIIYVLDGEDEAVSNYMLLWIFHIFLDRLLTSTCHDKGILLKIVELCSRVQQIFPLEFPSWIAYDRTHSLFWSNFQLTEDYSWSVRWILLALRVSEVAECTYVGVGASSAGTQALKQKNFKFLSVLIRYDMWNSEMQNDYFFEYSDFQKMWMDIRPHLRLNEDIDFTVVVSGAGRLWYRLLETHDTRKRVMLIMRTLKAVLLSSKEETDEYINCLSMSMDLLPDSMVSSTEVKELIHFLFGDEVTEEAVDQVVDKWVHLFGAQPRRPRSLKHLCRLTVREALANKSEVLPDLLEKLCLPMSVKSFILVAPDFI